MAGTVLTLHTILGIYAVELQLTTQIKPWLGTMFMN